MAHIDDFLNDSEKHMHEVLHDWCEEHDYWCIEKCPFYTEDNEKDPTKMHWCHCNYIEVNDKPHPAFLDALYRDYASIVHEVHATKPVNVDRIAEKLTEGINSFIKEKNAVEHPEHYNQGGIECIDAMISAFGKEAVAHFCIVNAFKYVWRASEKNGIEDIDKAIWYLNKYKELTADD